MELNKARTYATQTARHPVNGGECEFRISADLIMRKNKYGPDDVFYNLRNVPFAVNHPQAIFKGLDRDGHENSYCYAACPCRRFVSDNNSLPVEDGFVFLVFVTADFDIFDWRFEKTDDIDKQLPRNYKHRFGELIWQAKHSPT